MRAMVVLIACMCLMTAVRGQDSATLRRSAGQADKQPSPQQIQNERLTVQAQERAELVMAQQGAKLRALLMPCVIGIKGIAGIKARRGE